jgi:NodT family efflux transporter outer membrane factor (OMF) lipoprotein
VRFRVAALASTLVVTLAASLAGCAVGPTYRPAPTPKAGAGPFVAATPAAASPQAPPDRWWALYQDPALDALVQRALVENTDLRVAAANLAAARAALTQARAGFLPTTQATAGASYGVSSSTDLAAEIDHTHPKAGWVDTSGFTAAWELDLFGRIRRSVEAAKGDLQAEAAAADFVRVSVAAETTRAYTDACAYSAELVVARRALDVTTQSLKIITTQRDLGTASDYDVARQATLVEQTRASLPPLETQRRAALYQLSVLTGQPPETIDATASRCDHTPTLATPLPVGDGAALLRRRPDVREAERNLAAATARVGVATAALFPTVSLGGSIAGAGGQPGQMYSSTGLSYGVGPLVTWNVPNLVAAHALVRQAEARQSGALAQFDGTVLKALQDLEQSLSTYAAELDRHAALKAADDQADAAYRLAQLRYKDGSASYLDLLTTEQTLVQAELALAASDEAVATDQVSVFKALGGGWQGAPTPATRSAAAAR